MDGETDASRRGRYRRHPRALRDRRGRGRPRRVARRAGDAEDRRARLPPDRLAGVRRAARPPPAPRRRDLGRLADHRRRDPADQQPLDHPPVADPRAAGRRRPTRSSTISARSAMPSRSCREATSSISAAPTRRCPRPASPPSAAPAPGSASRRCSRPTARYHVLPTEGGHVDFAPLDAIEDAIVKRLRKTFTRVSAERSSPAPASSRSTRRSPSWRAARCRAATTRRSGPRRWTAPTRSRSPRSTASASRSARSRATSRWRTARKGVVIAGGLGLRIKDQLLRSGFDQRFVAKGRFQSLMAAIPVKLITHPQPGLFGAAAAFAQEHHVMTDIADIMRTSAGHPGAGDRRRRDRPAARRGAGRRRPARARGDAAHPRRARRDRAR